MTWKLPVLAISVTLEVAAFKEISALRLRSAELFCRKAIVVAMIKVIETSIYTKREKGMKKTISSPEKIRFAVYHSW